MNTIKLILFILKNRKGLLKELQELYPEPDKIILISKLPAGAVMTSMSIINDLPDANSYMRIGFK